MKAKLLELRGHVRCPARRSHPMRRRIFSDRIPTLLRFAPLLLLLAGKVHGDFVAPYALTPPEPGSYFIPAPGSGAFGDWTCLPTARALRVDTTFAPTNLVLDTEVVTRGVGGYFWARAAAAGAVTFEYTIAGEALGSFSWFNSGPDSPYASTFLMSISNFVAEPTPASFHVEAGDYFGFHISARPTNSGGFPPEIARRMVTIRNFVAPEPIVGLPTLSIHDVVVAEPTNGTANAAFPVRLSAAHTQAVTVAYSTTNATAAAGSDYEATSGTITFDPGETNKSISVTVLADTLPEGNETFLVVLANPINATLARSQATCTINELRITALAFHVDVSFNTVNQARYRVEWSEDASNWSPVAGAENVPGTGSIVTVTHTNAACNPSRVYRVLLLE